MTGRRAFLAALAALALPAAAAPVRHAEVRRGGRLVFPRDHGAHPDFRLEWWYLTGWLEAAGGPLGFQVTFFRRAADRANDNPSAFAPRQLLAAHAALADPARGRLLHDQRAGRATHGLAAAIESTTGVHIDDWRLALEDGRYTARIAAREFMFALDCATAAPPLLQGEAGWSRKGPHESQASWYYSRPQLAVRGRVRRGGRDEAVHGLAWLDHEWSSTPMAPEAAGWDWAGINLDDGGALMAFRMRAREGAEPLWAAATIAGNGLRRVFAPGEVSFAPGRRWRSPRTGIEYPVEFALRVGGERWQLAPLFDDQELDGRASTGVVYWEGAVRAAGARPGRGYLELTGYGRPLSL